MQIDERNVRGTFQINKLEGEEQASGDVKKPLVSLTLRFGTSPGFLDRYLSGHDSGAQPSAVFWRDYGPGGTARPLMGLLPPEGQGEGKTALFVRYLTIAKLTLVVPEKGAYTVKISSVRPEGVKGESWMGRREFLVGECQLKKAEVEFAKDTAIVIAKLRCHPEDGYARELLDLTLEEDVEISLWSGNTDLFQQSPPVSGAEASHESAAQVADPDSAEEATPDTAADESATDEVSLE